MKFAVFAFGLAALLFAPIGPARADGVDPSDVVADKIGGQDVMCIPMAKKQGLLDMAADQSAKVAHYTPEETAGFLRVSNAMPPVTTLTGENMLTFEVGPTVIVGFDEGDRFCRIAEIISKKAFDEIMKKAAASL